MTSYWLNVGLFKKGLTLAANAANVRKTTSCQRGIDEVGEERMKVRSNRLKKVRGDEVKRTGGWAVGGNQGRFLSLGERAEGEVRVGGEELDIGQVVSTGGMSSIFFKKYLKSLGWREVGEWG